MLSFKLWNVVETLQASWLLDGVASEHLLANNFKVLGRHVGRIRMRQDFDSRGAVIAHESPELALRKAEVIGVVGSHVRCETVGVFVAVGEANGTIGECRKNVRLFD